MALDAAALIFFCNIFLSQVIQSSDLLQLVSVRLRASCVVRLQFYIFNFL